jgi:hypothetical protein
MAMDSDSTKPSSSMVGTRPLGFSARYSGVRVPGERGRMSLWSYESPSSPAIHKVRTVRERGEP